MIIAAEDPDSADARVLVEELSAALAAITGDSGAASFASDDVRAEGGRFLIARGANDDLLGCGALRRIDRSTGELKRMYARPRSGGAGAALLAAIEQEAKSLGYRTLWLETRKVNLRAVAFYARHGYAVIPNYGKYIGRNDAICLGKDI